MTRVAGERSMLRARVLLGAAVSVSIVSGCSVTVGAPTTSSTHANESGYRQIWTRDWGPVIAASAAWNPSGGSPGVCDTGGTQQGCYDTDQRVLPLLKTLYDDLQSVSVPPRYVKANHAVVAALNLEGQGLADRDAGISTPNNTLFRHAHDELTSAASQLVAAYNEFPTGDYPAPAEFGHGRSS